MSHNRFFNHCLICAFILITGMGLALVLPLFAHSQGLASPSAVGEQSNAPVATRYYVTKTGDGTTGLEWTKAFTNVQEALGTAISGDEIWVASGVYTPGTILSDSFKLVPGVRMYGGFAGSETSRSERDWVANPTILSGDLAGDDTHTDGVVLTAMHITGKNNYHVVYADGTTGTNITESTKLDGFTITAGLAEGSVLHFRGGGFYCDGSGSGNECSPSLSNVSFSGNLADYGGAMWNDGEHGNSSPSLINVTFSGNSASNDGGAMYNYGRTNGISSPSLINVAFSGNSADYGGAMYNDGYNGGDSRPTMTNVTFSGNLADDGGAMYNDGSSSGNSNPYIRNSILWHNQDSSGTGTITSTIFNYRATITLTYSLVEGSGGSGGSWIGGSYVDGGGNIDSDPMFVTTGNLRLQTSSPAIDVGDNTYVAGILTDLDGEARIIDGNLDGTPTVDMGAYEVQIEEVYVPLIFR